MDLKLYNICNLYLKIPLNGRIIMKSNSTKNICIFPNYLTLIYAMVCLILDKTYEPESSIHSTLNIGK